MHQFPDAGIPVGGQDLCAGDLHGVRRAGQIGTREVAEDGIDHITGCLVDGEVIIDKGGIRDDVAADAVGDISEAEELCGRVGCLEISRAQERLERADKLESHVRAEVGVEGIMAGNQRGALRLLL